MRWGLNPRRVKMIRKKRTSKKPQSRGKSRKSATNGNGKSYETVERGRAVRIILEGREIVVTDWPQDRVQVVTTVSKDDASAMLAALKKRPA